MLLTGGASSRMGVDKASLEFRGVRLADRTARLLEEVADPTVEVGPGYTHLQAAPDLDPRLGPLSAVVRGFAAIQAMGWTGPVIVVATDLPLLTGGLLAWLAGHPSSRSVVPIDSLRPQPLCARYQPEDLETAADLFRGGTRTMRELLAAIDALLVGPEEWSLPAGHPLALADADTPADVERLRQVNR